MTTPRHDFFISILEYACFNFTRHLVKWASMFRRSHKKSRGGCLQWFVGSPDQISGSSRLYEYSKSRHVKCDESRPSCRLCAISGHNCSFLCQSAPNDGLRSDAASNDVVLECTGTSTATLSPLTAHATAVGQKSKNPSMPDGSTTVHIAHIELLLHLVDDHDMNILGGSVGKPSKAMMFAVQTGLQHPYLLYELLAFSARHLLYLQPERSSEFEHLAMHLQTQAISLFNAAKATVDESNCVAVLLFASILGHHVLTDTLAAREVGGVQELTRGLTQCMEVHRGIYTIATSTWPLLLSTELGPTVAWSAGFTSKAPQGDHCDPLIEMVARSEDLTKIERSALLLAIKYLQIGFDSAVESDEVDQGKKHQMVYSWPMLAAPEYSALLGSQRDEAIVVLAWYAVLLHLARDMWQVGDAGGRILNVVVKEIGAQWRPELEYAVVRLT